MPETFNCPDCAGPSQSPPMIYNTATYVQGTSTIRCMQCVRTWDVGLFQERFVGPGTVNPPKLEPSVPLSHGADLDAAMAAGPHKYGTPEVKIPDDHMGMQCQKHGCCVTSVFPKASAPTFYWCPEHEGPHMGTSMHQDYVPIPLKLPGKQPVSAHGEYIGKCPRCGKDVRVMHQYLYYPGDDSPYHSSCLIETLHERLQKTEAPLYTDRVKDLEASVIELRRALEEINPFLKSLHAGDTIEMARTLGIINRAREKYPLKKDNPDVRTNAGRIKGMAKQSSAQSD